MYILAPTIVQTFDSEVYRINHYVTDKYCGWNQLSFIIHRILIYLVDSVIYLLNKWDLEFQRGELKDIHEWQGDYWPYKEAQPIRLGSCVSSGEVSSLVVRPGYVTDNCFIQLECVSSLPNVHGVQVRGCGRALRWHLLNKLAPQLFISYTFGSLSLARSAAMQISWNIKNFSFT